MIVSILPPEALTSAIAGARGAAAGIAGDAHYIQESAELPPGAGPEALRHIAATLQARANRAALGALAVNACAARLEAYAHVLAGRIDHVRLALETEAARDVATYRQALRDGETDSPEVWASSAFVAWLDDAGADAIAPLDAEQAAAIYVTAFLRTLGGAS